MNDPKISIDNIIPAGSALYGIYPLGIYLPKIIEHHINSGNIFQTTSGSGTLKSKDIEELYAFVEKNGGKKVYIGNDTDIYFSWEHSLINIDYTEKTNSVTLAGYITDPKIVSLFEEINENFISTEVKDLVFTIVKSGDGFDLRSLGDSSSLPLIPENYNPEVISDLEYVVTTFNKNPPPSRICILNGEPGTGKTHLIRSMLSQIDNVFIILPSNLISGLDKPEFVPFLLKVKNLYEKPIILIVEDGDVCLVPRKTDNMSSITTLLNLSDGILGSIIDIKLIVTTNAHIKDMDHAIMRPGRLCKSISVSALPYDRANKIYQRLMENEEVNLEKRKFYTLAEVYDKFNNKDTPAHTFGKYQPLGFNLHKSSSNEEMILNLDK